MRPVHGLGHLAVRLPRSTRSTTTGACTTAPTSAPPAAQPLYAVGGGTVMSRVLLLGLRQPPLPRTSAWSTARTSPSSTTTCPATASAPAQRVSRGQVVGYVGTTGWSTGCHLHFTVLVNGTARGPDELAVPLSRRSLPGRACRTRRIDRCRPERMAGCRRNRGASSSRRTRRRGTTTTSRTPTRPAWCSWAPR